MGRNFLSYWKPETAERELGKEMNHSAGEQLKRVGKGDVVWIVTVIDGELFTLGRIVVVEVTGMERARTLLGTDDLWESTYHVIAEHGTIERVRRVSLRPIAGEIRFKTEGPSKTLRILNGRVSALQLQTMRELNPNCVGLLENAWKPVPG